MSGWVTGLVIAALFVITVGVFFLGTAFGPGQKEFDRLQGQIELAKSSQSLAESKVAKTESGEKLSQQQLTRAQDERDKFMKKWEDCRGPQ